jgi:putative hydrolase of the HAD superfamily
VPPLRALLLGVDDTIIDTRRAMVAAGTAAAAALWPDAPMARHAAFSRRFHDDPEGRFARFSAGEVSFEQMRRERVREAAGALGLERGEGRPALQAAFDEAYEPAFGAALRVFPDVAPLREAAGEVGVAVGLLTTSARAYTERKLRIVGLNGRFDRLFTRDTLGFGKPDPRVFAAACAALREPPAPILSVGDNLAWDVLPAADAGMPGAWLRRPGSPHAAAEVALAGERGLTVVASLEAIVAWLVPADLGTAASDR